MSHRLLAFLAAGWFLGATAWAAETAPFDPPMRDLWSRGDTRVLREWLLLGPLPGTLDADELAGEGGEAAVHPTGRWLQQPWGKDLLELSGVFSSKAYRGSGAAPEVAYAFRIIKSDVEHDAVISLGHDNGARVWLNGAQVFAEPSSTGFAFDREQIPIHLQVGDNRLLLKFDHRTGPWRFAARVLESGTIVASRDEIIPHVSGGPVLQVRAESAHSHADRPVEISVTAAGGRVVSKTAAARDQTVEIRTASWNDGAYELHFATKTAWGREVTVHVPWYKGSAAAAAQHLLADNSSAQIRMLADLIREKASIRAGVTKSWTMVKRLPSGS